MFEELRVGIYRFILEAGQQGLELPSFYGSTIRGAFGSAFKSIACANTAINSCHGCEVESTCPYAYIFETTPPPQAEKLKNYDDVPRPFMFLAKLEDRTFYKQGELLEVELRLFGKGNDFFPYFVLAFIRMGENGLGARRRPFRLRKVIGVNPFNRSEQVVFDGETSRVFTPKNILEGKQIFADMLRQSQQLRVKFLTPVRIKENGNLVVTVQFHHLARSLVRRASALMYFHHGINLDIDYKGLTERSRLPKRLSNKTSWNDLERYSQRQGGKLKMGGVVGEVIYEGHLTEFIPLLEFGRWCGVGKNCVFGLGQMDYVVME